MLLKKDHVVVVIVVWGLLYLCQWSVGFGDLGGRVVFILTVLHTGGTVVVD